MSNVIALIGLLALGGLVVLAGMLLTVYLALRSIKRGKQ